MTPTTSSPDLASIVLERQPAGPRVAVLALLVVAVAAVAATGGWLAGQLADDPAAQPAAAAAVVDAPQQQAAASPVAEPAIAASTPVAAGANPAIARIIAVGGGSASDERSVPAIRVAISNAGSRELPAESEARLVVLVDGELAGSEPIGALAADGGRVVVELSEFTCGSQPRTVSALIHAPSTASDINVADSVSSRRLVLAC